MKVRVKGGIWTQTPTRTRIGTRKNIEQKCRITKKKYPMLMEDIHRHTLRHTSTDNMKQNAHERKRKFRSHNLQILILS